MHIAHRTQHRSKGAGGLLDGRALLSLHCVRFTEQQQSYKTTFHVYSKNQQQEKTHNTVSSTQKSIKRNKTTYKPNTTSTNLTTTTRQLKWRQEQSETRAIVHITSHQPTKLWVSLSGSNDWQLSATLPALVGRPLVVGLSVRCVVISWTAIKLHYRKKTNAADPHNLVQMTECGQCLIWFVVTVALAVMDAEEDV